MASTTSPNVGLELQATGDNNGTWGTKLNADLSILDLRLGGRLNKNVAGAADITLTATEARNIYHNMTGVLTGNINYIFPSGSTGLYTFKNASTGAFLLTVKPSGGTGVAVPQGQTISLFIDPDQTAAVVFTSPFIDTGGSLTFNAGALRRAALTGDVTASADSNATSIAVVTTRGDLLTRGAAAAARLPIGANNTIIGTDGVDPIWRTLSVLLDNAIGSTRGMVAVRGAATWGSLAIGANGTLLQSNATDPSWTAAATAGEYRANTANKFLDTAGVWAAAAYVGLTDAATIAVDLSAGINFSLTMINNRTLGNPTNTKDGQSGIIVFTQDGTGSRTLAYSGNWKFAGGTAPVLTTTIAARDILVYQVISSTVIYANLVKDVK